MAAKKTFEVALKELENIVLQMESGDLAIEDALKKYETGMKQAKFCSEILDKIEGKITVLTETTSGKIKEEPFEK